MLKVKTIIRDLKHLKGNKIFNYYDVERNAQRSKNLEIGMITLVEELARYEVDFKKLYGVDFDDVIYNDAQGDYCNIDLDVESDNSYNWNGQRVFNFNLINVDGTNYVTIKFHRYGDVRGNYTDYMVLDFNRLDLFFEVMMEASSVYTCVNVRGVEYEISTDIFNEACVFRIYSNDADIDDDHAVLDIDNLRNKKDIKKALIEYLKGV